MKNRIWLMFGVLVLVLTLGVGGYQGISAATNYVTIGTGGTGGTFYAVGAGLSKVLNNHLPGVSASAESTGGSGQNVRLLGTKDIEFAFASSDALYFAYTGQREFKKAIGNLRLVVMGYGADYHIMVRKDSGIRRIEDLVGKRIASYPGNTSEFQTPILLKSYGIERKDYTTVPLLPSEQVTAMRDGNIDAIITTIGTPNASFSDLTTTHDIRFLPVSDEKRQAISSQHPYYTPSVIPAGSYRGQDEDIPTLAGRVALITHKDVPEELVYNVLKTLTDYNDELAQIHPAGAAFAVRDMTGKPLIPLHPGAEKYLREIGVIQ